MDPVPLVVAAAVMLFPAFLLGAEWQWRRDRRRLDAADAARMALEGRARAAEARVDELAAGRSGAVPAGARRWPERLSSN